MTAIQMLPECRYFAWPDPLLCKQSLEFFPNLLKRIKIWRLKSGSKERRLKIALVVSRVLVLVVVRVAQWF